MNSNSLSVIGLVVAILTARFKFYQKKSIV